MTITPTDIAVIEFRRQDLLEEAGRRWFLAGESQDADRTIALPRHALRAVLDRLWRLVIIACDAHHVPNALGAGVLSVTAEQ